jgi:hypothetical protein
MEKSMSDWWSKKIAGDKPTPTRTTTTPPTTPPLRFPAPQQQRAPHVHQTAHNQNVLDPNRAPTEQISMGEALRLWKGGEAARKEGDSTCPECGSIYVFSRVGRGSNSMINGAQPAPRCYSCGWNGRYSQADQTNWGV